MTSLPVDRTLFAFASTHQFVDGGRRDLTGGALGLLGFAIKFTWTSDTGATVEPLQLIFSSEANRASFMDTYSGRLYWEGTMRMYDKYENDR